ncbi:MAG TPA: alanine--glyoxylate aminotransferase family protein [Thermoprotei archaeon]|nr:alanine--glyoxylate aminotransferase family protein [Thermoprotei archaeon]
MVVKMVDPLLMIPGPSNPYPEAVKEANSRFIPHYGEEFLKLYWETVNKLKRLFGTKSDVYLYPGQATSVVEMILNSILDKGDYIIFIGRGFFVDRFRRIAELYGGKPVNIASERIGSRINVSELEYILKSIAPKAVFLVHSETSTGLLEDIDSISSVILDNTFFIVDAVSIFGAIEYKSDEWRIDACIGYSSKALGALPGVTPFMLSEKLTNYILDRKSHKGFLNDLKTWIEYKDLWKHHPYPVSLSSPIILSIKGAVDRILDEGIKNIEYRHRKISKLSIEYASSIGIEKLPEDGFESPTVTVGLLNNNYDARHIAEELLKNYNIMISTTWLIGLNGLRIGHMGYNAREDYIEKTYRGIEEIIKSYK